jgi:choline-sulfatase
MKSRPVLAAVACLLALSAILPLWRCSGRRPSGRGLNLLLVTLDTTRSDRLGCYGDAAARTPVLDGLARGGVRFENAYSPVPLTLPAHASLLTGKWPPSHGVRNNGRYALPAQETTLAEVLSGADYDTAAILAAYVLQARFGLNQGFSVYDDQLDSHARTGDLEAEINAGQVYAKFRSWLKRPRDAGKPFFLWLHFYDPHKPYAPPAEFLKRAGNDPYRGELANVDDCLGRVLGDLERRGLLARTLVAVAGDHGEGFGEHGEAGHGIFGYEESLRVPVIFSSPALFPRPEVISSRISLVDLMPTLLHLLGIPEKTATSQGRVLFDRRFRPAVPPGPLRTIYFESLYGRELNNWAPLTGLIHGDWKYVSLPQAELYDLRSDPRERVNLFLRQQRQAREMDQELAFFLSQQAGPGPEAKRGLSQTDAEKLRTLGYVSSFSASGRSGIDPKTGVRWHQSMKPLIQELNNGRLATVEEKLAELFREPDAVDYPYLYVLRGMLLERKKDWRGVERNLLEAIRRFSGTPSQDEDFRLNLLDFYLSNRRWPEARGQADVILSQNPAQPRAHEALGQLAEERGDPVEALRHYRAAQSLEPGNASLRKRCARLLIQRGEWPAARQELAPLLQDETAAADGELMFSAAMVAVQLGDLAQAEQLLGQVEARAPSAESHFEYAVILARNGKREAAVAAMEKALNHPPPGLPAEQKQAARQLLARWRQLR